MTVELSTGAADDWKAARLRDVATFGSGTTPSRARQEEYFSYGKHLWVKTLDLNNSIILATQEKVTDRALEETSLKIYSAGTVLVAMYGGYQQIGRTGLLSAPASVNQAITAVTVDQRSLIPAYLLHTLNYHVGYWRSVASSSRKDPNITGSDVKDFPILLPRVAEQEAITEALSDVDRFISQLEKVITKKKAIIQGMLQQLLTGRTRLPGFDAPWSEARLGSLLKRPPRYGINAAAVPLSIDAHTYIRITDIDDSGHFAPQPKVGVRHPNAGDYLLNNGELVFARTGASVGKSYLYNAKDGALVYAGFLINIAPDSEVLDPKYLAFFAQTAPYWNWVARTSVRSGQPGINGREYAQLQMAVPDIREQRAIVDAVQKADDEIRLLDRRLTKAKAVKQGMMQKLLTGRTRLPVEEGAA
ncbi:restriction endonuclease subunit S [Streptomyces albidoflavus]|uniref:restriction endonuclease subunit S n=1 Tax=Streptomyces albidoflavus TaxID=1886 RepID=UPI0034426FD7